MTNTFFKYPIKRLEKGGNGGSDDDYSDGDDIIMVVIRMLMIFIMSVMVVNRSLLRTDKFHFGSVFFFLLGALCSLGRPQANDSPASCPSFLNAEISGRCGHTDCFLQEVCKYAGAPMLSTPRFHRLQLRESSSSLARMAV